MGAPGLETVVGIVSELYKSVSFAPGEEPVWNAFRQLFAPNACLVPPRTNPLAEPEVIDVEAFIARSTHNLRGTPLGANGFFERETSRQVSQFGDVIHVLSAYVARHEPTGEDIGSGVNSIQIIRGATRLWLVCVAWDQARPGLPVPVLACDASDSRERDEK